MRSGRQENQLPRWILLTIDAALFGNRDEVEAAEHRRRWAGHFSDLRNDSSTNTLDLTIEVILSALSHAWWRITAGPATTVAPGLLVSLIGSISIAFVFSPSYEITSTTTAGGVFSTISGLLIMAEARTRPRSLPTRILWALVVLILTATGLDYWFNPVVPSDAIASIGLAILTLSVAPNLLIQRRRTAWRRWALMAVGFVVLGLSNLFGTREFTDPDAVQVATLLFAMELAAGLVLMRWALSRRSDVQVEAAHG